jgi:hypothetical protein
MRAELLLARDPRLPQLATALNAPPLSPTQLEHHVEWIAGSDHGPKSSAAVLALYDADRVAAYVPLRHGPDGLPVKIAGKRIVRLPYRTVQLYGPGVVAIDDELVPRAIEACHELPWPFEAFNLWDTPVESPLWRAVERGALAGLRPLERGRSPRYLIDLPSSFDSYLGHFSGKSRATLRRKARRLEEVAGPLSLGRYVRPGDMASWLRTIAPVFLKTYHHHLLDLNLTPNNLELVRNLEHCARRGWVRSYVLFAGERPIAYVLGYLTGRQFRYEMPGYDPELAEHSPGLALLLRLIEDLIEDGSADVVDFGSGDQEYKKLFSTRSYLEVSALLVRTAPRARGTAAIYGALTGASRLGARLLERHGIKRRVLGWLRRGGLEGRAQPILSVTPPRPASPIVVVPAAPPRPRAAAPSRAAPPPAARPAGTASPHRRTDR